MKLEAIVLAAGQGTRMNHPELPKVLVPLAGRPILAYVLEVLRVVGVERPVVVVKYRAELVRQTFTDGRFVDQGEQTGTGAAALAVKSELGQHDGLIYITNGDCPCFSTKTYEALSEAIKKQDVAVVLATSHVHSIEERYGRIVRAGGESVERIVEYKDATEEERQLTEYNAGLYLVRSPWLWSALERIQPSGVTGEYYLTDIVALARADGLKVLAVPVVDPADAHGINTPEELAEAERILKERA